MHYCTTFILFSLLLVLPKYLWAEEKINVRYYQQQERYNFGLELLTLSLSKLNTPFGIHASEFPIANEARGERLVIKGELDLEWMSATDDREKKMIPVKVPIYRGILGLRLLLVTNKNHEFLSQVKTVNGLRRYVGGHGKHWGDLPVYAANNLPVITNANYEGLFKQLIYNRFDYFHRGLNEIWQEQTRYLDELTIADNVMLYYPQPVYYFVTKQRPELAEQIRRGLQKAIADGSYKALFLKTYREIIQQGKLDTRSLITLQNPTIPIGTPPIDTSWWLPQKFRTQLENDTKHSPTTE